LRLKSDGAVLLHRSLLDGFKLSFQPVKVISLCAFAGGREGRWPKYDDTVVRSSSITCAPAVTQACDFEGYY
jgi:hypothetical protein